MASTCKTITLARLEGLIYLVRSQKVMLDRDLAALYGVETRALNQAVRRNRDRFPDDFAFALTREEIRKMSQFVISSGAPLKFSKRVLVFTEQGVAMLSSVLRSPRAVRVNVEIMRAFVRLRQMLASNAELARRLGELEEQYDEQFKVVFDAIRRLMAADRGRRSQPRREIGFHTLHDESGPLPPPRRRPRKPVRYRP